MSDSVEQLGVLVADRQRQDVELELTGHALCVWDRQDELLAQWPLQALELLEAPTESEPAVFRHRASGVELEIANGPLVLTMRAAADHLRRTDSGWNQWAVVGAWLTGSAVAAGLLALASVTVVPRLLLEVIPAETAEAYGDSTYAWLFEDVEVCEDPAAQRELEALLSRLWRRAPDRPRIYPVVSVVNLREVNAVALPGGRLVVFRGLLDQLESPDAFAGVLAHELGHAYERHPMQARIRAGGIALALALLTSGGAEAAGVALDLGGYLTQAALDREAERSADRLAGQMLDAAGIDRAPLAEFLEQLDPGETPFSFVSTHPPGQTRAAQLRERQSHPVRPALTDAAWRDIRGMCNSLGRPTSLLP